MTMLMVTGLAAQPLVIIKLTIQCANRGREHAMSVE